VDFSYKHNIDAHETQASNPYAFGRFYRERLRLDARPAHRALRLDDGTIVCTCSAGAQCIRPGKHPIGLWREDARVPHERWMYGQWRREHANISILSGSRSRVIVLDVDLRHGGMLETLWGLGWPQETCIEQSGSGGWHLYYRMPDEVERLATQHDYAAGVELLADGAQVIAAPSLHVSGNYYRWLDGHEPWNVKIAPLPDTMLLSLRPVQREARERVPYAPAPLSEGELSAAQGTAVKLVQQAVQRVCEQHAARHPTGIWLSMRLVQLRLPHDELVRYALAYQEAVR
jgi:hypothetical protein